MHLKAELVKKTLIILFTVPNCFNAITIMTAILCDIEFRTKNKPNNNRFLKYVFVKQNKPLKARQLKNELLSV